MNTNIQCILKVRSQVRAGFNPQPEPPGRR